VRLVSAAGERELELAGLYNNDGMAYLTRKPDEILTEVVLPEAGGWRSTYWKLRRRGSFDFPLLGVAAAAQLAPDGTVTEARLVLGAVASQPVVASKAGEFLAGKKLSEEVIAEAGALAASRAKPMDNTDLDVYWRKEVVPSFVGYALRELRGDDMRAGRLRIARQAL
jgi:CO/xanthine dehydrogenase FAD-binding subunit